MSRLCAIRGRGSVPRAARNRNADNGAADRQGRLPGSLSAVPGTIQRMPVLGAVDDAFETQAEAVAERVAAGHSAPAISPLSGADAAVRRDPADGGGASGAAQAVAAVGGAGRSLDTAERGYFEPRFGRDLSGVRIHNGTEVDAAAAGIGARAYTVGSDIAIASGEYAPDTGAGRRLMAHELAHTVQQTGATGPVRRQTLPEMPDPEELLDRATRWGERQWDRAERWGDRQMDRAERYGERGAELAEEAADRAGEMAESAGEDAEGWWNRGSGDITRIDFDGSEVRVSGTSPVTYRAISGLMAHNRHAGGVDYTGPEHQYLANKGPIPEGTYYLNPSEVESNPPGTFPTRGWGHFRTRLHETMGTNLWRRAASERTGGFYLHQDADHNGTAGCIGIWEDLDNADIHARIRANSAQIPVHVDYPAPAAPATPAAGEDAVRRLPAAAGPAAAAQVSGRLAAPALVQRQDHGAAEEPEPHYLIAAGIARIDADLARYGAGGFPSDYYDQLARHLYRIALRHTGRDYGDAFSVLNDLQWNEFGPGLQNHYTAVVGTDSANGWDKFRHFVFTAFLQYYSGGFLAPEGFTYGKEIYDEVEQFFGADPEGYSVPDIRADNRGERFAEEMADQRDRERMEAARRAVSRGLDALIDPRTYGVGF